MLVRFPSRREVLVSTLPSSCIWRRVGVSMVFAVAGMASGVAQPRAGCGGGKPLTLTQVVGYIDQKISEETTVLRIEACRVSFRMDGAALDRLADAGASGPVMDALNRVTVSQLKVEQAHEDVAGLERRAAEADKAAVVERDAALRKLDEAYKAKREQASHLDPKGQFESTADYNARKHQNDSALAEMDRNHEAERTRLAANYAGNASGKSQLYNTRILFLKSSTYPDARPLTYRTYDADSQQLTATVGTEMYRFDHVPPKSAETLVKTWPKVKTTQPYTEADPPSRTLVLETASISVTGSPLRLLQEAEQQKKTAEINRHLDEAKARMDRQDYSGAAAEYQSALALDAGNRIAKDGLAAAGEAKQRQAALSQEMRKNGMDIDPDTKLMWTLKDNGSDISWKAAEEYCQALRTGGFSDWRLASIAELRGIYDPKLTAKTVPTTGVMVYRENGATKSFPIGTYWIYHIKGKIVLTHIFIWSATKDKSGSYDGADNFNFFEGMLFRNPVNYKQFLRALCVRPTVPGAGVADAPQPAPETQSMPTAKPKHSQVSVEVFQKYVASCNARDAHGCEMAGYSYKRGDGVDKDLEMARQYYQKSCDLGRKLSCNELKFLK